MIPFLLLVSRVAIVAVAVVAVVVVVVVFAAAVAVAIVIVSYRKGNIFWEIILYSSDVQQYFVHICGE